MTKPRNPYVALLHNPLFRQRVVENKKTSKRDEIPNSDDDAPETINGGTIQLGDRVLYKGEEGIVKVPKGPLDMVGVSVDGEYQLLHSKDLKIIKENIDRLMLLAEQKYFTVTSGVRIPISQEEEDILKKCEKELAKVDLDERDKEVARRMVSRGLLKRITRGGKIYFEKESTTLRRS